MAARVVRDTGELERLSSIRMDSDDNECLRCHSSVSHLYETQIDWGAHKGETVKVCALCYHLHASSPLENYNNYPEGTRKVVQSLLEVGNVLREELLALRDEVRALRKDVHDLRREVEWS